MKLILTGLLMLMALARQAWPAELIVVVQGVRSEAGSLRVALFDSAKGFPMDASLAIAHQLLELVAIPTNKPKTFVFINLSEKKYAVCVFHDEDGDGKLKANLLGIPKEGVGVSNNIKGFPGSPKFEAALFDLKGTLKISVTLVYY